MGKLTKEQIRKNMQANKSTGTKPELLLAKTLFARGLRYRKNDKSVFGTPDLTFKKIKLAVFVDGEFWHGKDWASRKHDHISNQGFWTHKIERNLERDKSVNEALAREGWTILRFWGADIHKKPLDCAWQIEREVERLKMGFKQKTSIETAGDKQFKVKVIEPDDHLDAPPAHFFHRNHELVPEKEPTGYNFSFETALHQAAEDEGRYNRAEKIFFRFKNHSGYAGAFALPDPDDDPDEFLRLFLNDEHAGVPVSPHDKEARMNECFRRFYRLILTGKIEIAGNPEH